MELNLGIFLLFKNIGNDFHGGSALRINLFRIYLNRPRKLVLFNLALLQQQYKSHDGQDSTVHGH
jgi:hypothetical protein